MQEQTKSLATSLGTYMQSAEMPPLPSFQTSIADHSRLQTCMKRPTPQFVEKPQCVLGLYFRGFKCMKYDPGPSTTLLLLNTELII